MRNNNRIIKIVNTVYPKIFFISNNGEYRSINIKTLFDAIHLQKGNFGYEIIENKNLFEQVTLEDHALAWKEVTKSITLTNSNKITTFFHLDPNVTIELSTLDDHFYTPLKYGHMIKEIRKKELKISQEVLGKRIGTDKQYISKVENLKTDIELKSLRKIFEVGLGKKLFIGHYRADSPFDSITNSVFTRDFLIWADKSNKDLTLIEGIGQKTKDYLKNKGVMTPKDLTSLSFKEYVKLIFNKKKYTLLHHPDTWKTQAFFIINSDWLSLIKIQRSLSNKRNSNHSKIEELAKKALGEEIFLLN